MTINLKDFNWMNESELNIEGNNFFIKATPHSDFFRNPIDGTVTATAPFLYKELTGDFLISVCVRPTFTSTYDACSIFIYSDEKRWLKVAFEYTDLDTHSIVTVATNTYSDDANGVDINEDWVYLQVIRKGDVFACHYSKDGIDYKMTRLLHLATSPKVKVGISAQSPIGEGQFMEFKDLKITHELPEDIRKSI